MKKMVNDSGDQWCEYNFDCPKNYEEIKNAREYFSKFNLPDWEALYDNTLNKICILKS
jgi:hypothetical protein